MITGDGRSDVNPFETCGRVAIQLRCRAISIRTLRVNEIPEAVRGANDLGSWATSGHIRELKTTPLPVDMSIREQRPGRPMGPAAATFSRSGCRGYAGSASRPLLGQRRRLPRNPGGRRCLPVGVVRLDDLDEPGARWRVFISHTSELRNYPKGMSYVAAVERAISGRPRRFRTAETVFSKLLPAMPGTRCGPPAEAGTRLPSEDASDCNAVRCSAQYHAWPFRGWDRPCGTRALS